MITTRAVTLLALLAAPLAAQELPPVRPLGETVARSTEVLGSVSTAVPLPGGKILVNDILRRRVLLFDSSMTSHTVVADSTSSTANAYGGRTGGLLQYKGDSALFVDPASMSMLVIKPNGEIGRVMSAPRPQDVGSLIGGPNGIPGFDPTGRMVYREPVRPAIGRGRGAGNGPMMPEFPDSVPIVRFDLAARSLDTVAFVGIARPNIQVTQSANGSMMMTSTTNPIPVVDDWALLSDGSIAVVRGKDYSIDWVAPDGTRSSTGKVPYEWQRLDDSGKYALLDSARKEIEKQREMAMQRFTTGGGAPVAVNPGGGGGGGGDMVAFRMGAEASAARGRAGAPAGGRGGPEFTVPPVNMVNAADLPDYRPPFTSGAARGDYDGNLWVRTTSPVGNAGPVYYVINREGKVVDRVQVPEQRLIVGFSRDGDVFLAVRDAEGNARVERARVK